MYQPYGDYEHRKERMEKEFPDKLKGVKSEFEKQINIALVPLISHEQRKIEENTNKAAKLEDQLMLSLVNQAFPSFRLSYIIHKSKHSII